MDTEEREVQQKFELAGRVLAAAGAQGEPLGAELDAARLRLTLATSHLYLSGDPPAVLRQEYRRVLSQLGVGEEVERLVRAAARSGKAHAPLDEAGKAGRKRAAADSLQARVYEFFDALPAAGRDAAAREVRDATDATYRRCPECRVEMDVRPGSSELQCGACGAVVELFGTVFDESQMHGQTGQRAKSGGSNPNRHYYTWMDRIHAQESTEEIGDPDDPENVHGEKVVAAIRAEAARRRLILQNLTIYQLRDILKSPRVARTDLNKNSALLLALATGIRPPTIPERLRQKHEEVYKRLLPLDEELRAQSDRPNRGYFPHMIYKIYDDAVLPRDDLANRRILYYIYLQGDDTLGRNNRHWAQVCRRDGGIEPTYTHITDAEEKYGPSVV